MDLPLYIQGDALVDLGFDNLGCLIPEDHVMSLGFLYLIAFFVGVYFVGGQGKAGHPGGFVDLVYPGIVADVSHECGLVTCHPF